MYQFQITVRTKAGAFQSPIETLEKEPSVAHANELAFTKYPWSAELADTPVSQLLEINIACEKVAG